MSSGRYSKTRFKERIKKMPIEQLESLRDELKTDLSDLNRQRNWTGMAGPALDQSAQLKTTRKNIARIETRIIDLKRTEG